MNKEDVSTEEVNTEEVVILNEKKEENEDFEDLPLRYNYSIPRKIKRIKIIIAVMINFVIGGMMTALAIYYFVNPPEENTMYWRIFGIFLVLFGGFLLIQFPMVFLRTINSNLKLEGKNVFVRNVLNWKALPWDDIQEIYMREKLTKELDKNELIAIDIIRFRTVNNSIHFFTDSYPSIDAEQMKKSLKEIFSEKIVNTNYHVNERVERPTISMRITYYIKTPN
ncbi:MAG TPA: hypothetical protein VMZ29_16590 [Candidatus Bathyarchaeia archaeon]|nr:hypothetical protein [Candidatus Bathyarchaeia archaeon]